MVGAVMLAGVVAEAAAWWVVSARRGNVWTVVTPVLVAMALAAAIVGSPLASEGVGLAIASIAGAAAGAALYLGTRLFSTVVRGWEGFGRQARAIYERRIPLTLVQAIVLSAAVAAPAEEVFWRGFLQVEVARAFDGRTLVAAVVAWGLFVLANLASANLAIVLGAMVGGAVWSVLGAWSGGFAAPLACHAVWTALMLSFPVVAEPADVTT